MTTRDQAFVASLIFIGAAYAKTTRVEAAVLMVVLFLVMALWFVTGEDRVGR